MSITVSSLSGGAAYVAFNSKEIIQESDGSLDIAPVTEVLSSALYGKFDELPTDLVLKYGFTPRYYDTAQLSTLFPYIGAVQVGAFYGGGNVAASINSSNSDQFVIQNAMVGKMPDLILGMDKTIMGPMEFWGVIQSGQDPTDTDAYYTFNASGGSYTYAAPTVPGTAYIGQQEYIATFGSVTGMTSFQAQETWTISHELEWEPVKIQARTRCFRLNSYRAMAKCMPADATMANILAAFGMQGTNATQGTTLAQLAKAANSGSLPTLTLAGTSSVTAVLENVALKTAGFKFGSKPLRQGEIGFVSSLNLASGTPSAPLALS